MSIEDRAAVRRANDDWVVQSAKREVRKLKQAQKARFFRHRYRLVRNIEKMPPAWARERRKLPFNIAFQSSFHHRCCAEMPMKFAEHGAPEARFQRLNVAKVAVSGGLSGAAAGYLLNKLMTLLLLMHAPLVRPR